MKRKSDGDGDGDRSHRPIKIMRHVLQTSYSEESTYWNKPTQEMISEILRNQDDSVSCQNTDKETFRPAFPPTASPSPALDTCSEPVSPPDIQTAPEATTRTVPDNSDTGAASSFEEAKWLSTTAICRVLEKIPSGNFKIYDAAFLKVDNPNAMLRKESVRSWDKGPSVFPVNHCGEHWTLIVLDPKATLIEFYNSLTDPFYEEAAREGANCWIQRLRELSGSELYQKEWPFSTRSCPSQNNKNDCGIATIVYAIYRILNRELPPKINFAVWRRVLRNVILHSLPYGPEPSEDAAINQTSTPFPMGAQLSQDQQIQLGDTALLDNHFSSCVYAHGVAREDFDFASEVLDTIDCLISNFPKELEAAIAQRDQQNVVAVDHANQLEQYRSLKTHNADMVKGFERIIKSAQKEEADAKARMQTLQRNKACWEAGRTVSVAEKERQEEKVQSTRVAMEEIIQRFDTQDRRLRDEEQRLRERFREEEKRLKELMVENERVKQLCLKRLEAV